MNNNVSKWRTVKWKGKHFTYNFVWYDHSIDMNLLRENIAISRDWITGTLYAVNWSSVPIYMPIQCIALLPGSWGNAETTSNACFNSMERTSKCKEPSFRTCYFKVHLVVWMSLPKMCAHSVTKCLRGKMDYDQFTETHIMLWSIRSLCARSDPLCHCWQKSISFGELSINLEHTKAARATDCLILFHFRRIYVQIRILSYT